MKNLNVLPIKVSEDMRYVTIDGITQDMARAVFLLNTVLEDKKPTRLGIHPVLFYYLSSGILNLPDLHKTMSATTGEEEYTILYKGVQLYIASVGFTSYEYTLSNV